MENIELVVMLLFGITFLAVLSNRYNFPVPLTLVLTGLVIALIPGLPIITLQPEVVFLVFLPPLLYGAAWNTSWHEFRATLRPISLAAFGLVFFTTALVGIIAYYLIPSIGWAEAFLLGAIISPPDAVAAAAITRGLKLHPRIMVILEGESLMNDASALVAYKYALAAVISGSFILWEAGIQFLLVAGGGIALGLAIGYIMYWVHKKLITDPIIEVVLTLLTPYASYLLAEHFHLSGVLAVVTTGLYLSYQSAEIFTHHSRIQAYAVWDNLLFLLNGLIFVLIGLQLRFVVESITNESTSLIELIGYGVLISVATFVIRLVWVIPAAILPRMFSKKIREREYFDKRALLVFSWAGMRGVVSLAAALAIPLTTQAGINFPNRNLIIFLTFCVVIFTLLAQGTTLPWLIKTLKLPKHSIMVDEYKVRNEIVNGSISHIEENLATLNDSLLNKIKNKYEIKFSRLQKSDLPLNENGRTSAEEIFNQFAQLQIDLISVERSIVQKIHKEGRASDEILRKIERELDLEETRLRMEMYES